MLQGSAVCCSVMRFVQCVAVCCSVLQCVAVCYSVLCRLGEEQVMRFYPEIWADMCCSVLQGIYSTLQCVAGCCSVLQCVVECCSVLQYASVCCSVLQYVTV